MQPSLSHQPAWHNDNVRLVTRVPNGIVGNGILGKFHCGFFVHMILYSSLKVRKIYENKPEKKP